MHIIEKVLVGSREDESMVSKKTVAVIFGGQSSEHEVSRTSAVMMLQALDKEKYQVLSVGITKKGQWLIYNGPVEHVKTGEWEKFGTPVSLSPDATKKCFLKIVGGNVKEIPVDVVIPVLHGAWGEDGTIQGLLEMAQIPYVGCGVLASAVSMDKVYTKMIAKAARIPQAKYLWLHKNDLEEKRERILDHAEKKLGYPCFVKPSNAGSSVGISKAKNREQLSAALDLAAGYDRKVIIEEAIDAREFECAVLGNEEPMVSGVGEVLSAAEFYDYDAKYNNSDSRTVIPAEVEEEKTEEMRRIARKIFRAVDGSGLARVDFFIDKKTGRVLFNELNTMPGFAGSSAYYVRYMDPHNNQALVSEKADHYWQNVDLYVGGTEHATGHLIYSRFWNKFLHDLGVSIKEEPFQKLVNQGMIQGRSNFVYRIKDTNTFVSLNLKDQYETTPLHVDVNIVSNDILDTEAFKAWRPEYNNAEFILEDGKYICGWAVEKMSKSMYNVVNPDMIVEKYGADTLRMYEMFLGPVEQSKPWDTNGIDGVHRFLKKLWNLFYSRTDEFLPVESEPTKEELKAIHKLIKKVTGDIETFSYNTSISAFMICVNELTSLKCRNKEVLSNLIILLAPFAPHYAEELWEALGNTTSVCDAQWPAFNEDYLKEDTVKYTISFNGKARFTMDFAADADNNTIQTTVMADEQAQKWIEGKTPKKVIIVPKKIVNIVL